MAIKPLESRVVAILDNINNPLVNDGIYNQVSTNKPSDNLVLTGINCYANQTDIKTFAQSKGGVISNTSFNGLNVGESAIVLQYEQGTGNLINKLISRTA